MAGVQDAEAAAREAAMQPQEAEAAREAREAAARETDAMRDDILSAVVSKQWLPGAEAVKLLPRDAKVPQSTDTEAWKALLDNLDKPVLEAWVKALNTYLDTAVEDEDDEQIKAALQHSIGIGPDDPMYDAMQDRERRHRIEAVLKPLDFEAMVFTGYCTQEVPIRANLVATFRTIPTQHGLWLEYMIAKEPESSYQLRNHTFSLMQLACSLDKLNDKATGPDITRMERDTQRDEFITAMRERLATVCRYPAVLSDDLIVQYVWFTGRVRRLLTGDLMRKVGNS
jgi:hypothetical protein